MPVPVRVRFAPSPTGSLHLGSALTAVANRSFADEQNGVALLRIDDTDAGRADPGAEAAILEDLSWLGLSFEEGPVRQSERGTFYSQAAEKLVVLGAAAEDSEGAIRFLQAHRPTLVRADGRPTYHLASVVDDIDLGVTHVIRGKDLLPSTDLHRALAGALEASAPEYVHHGLLLGPDGAKLSKRRGAESLADLRARGVPAQAVRRYLEELGLPRADVHFDDARLRRLSTDALAAMPDEDLAAAARAPARLAPALRGARDLAEARIFAHGILTEPPAAPSRSPETLARFRELREQSGDDLDMEEARELVRELKAVGGDLRALRLALTGAERGPELWAVLLALPRDETLRRIAAASG